MKIVIEPDEMAVNPRDEFDNLGTFGMAHRRHSFAEADSPSTPDDIERAAVEAVKGGGVALPVFLYDHSGLSVSTSPYSCPWDSGRIGTIWATREDILRTFGKRRMSPTLRQKAIDTLRQEITALDCYLRGEIYAALLVDDTGTVIDSFCGIYGRDDAEQAGRELMRGIADGGN